MKYRILLPMHGFDDWYELAVCDTAEAVGELVRYMLAAWGSSPRIIKIDYIDP